MVIVEAQGLFKSLGRRAVLRGFDLSLERGERVVILGENGSGKSTLLQIVAGVIEPDAGALHTPKALGFRQKNRTSPII